MRIDHIYRYPVKGLSAEALEEVQLSPGEMLPHDRAFALAQGDAPFDPAAPAWLPKRNFACLMANAQLALLHTSYDPRRERLVVRGPGGLLLDETVATAAGRERIAAALTHFLGDAARGDLRFVGASQHRFSDSPEKFVSLIGQASIAALEAAMGVQLDPLRFRANVYFSGAPAWAEFDWLGQRIEVGGATLEVVARIDRCAATTVNPATAVRDAQVPKALRQAFGHIDMGVFARVVAPGRIALGDALVPRTAAEPSAI
jgi:hypothetical protein